MIRVRSAGPIHAGVMVLDAEEAHHLEVRRVEAGAAVEVLDGAGGIGLGVVEAAGTQARVMVASVRTVARPADLVLLVGAGDRDRFLRLVEQAVEAGVTRLVPVETVRSRNVASRIRAEHGDKMVRRAAEALKQSGGAWALSVDRPRSLNEAIGNTGPGHRWLADLGADPAPKVEAADPVTVAIGPEGGFTGEERAALMAGGFIPVRFGARTMRFETAALAAAVVAGLARKETDG